MTKQLYTPSVEIVVRGRSGDRQAIVIRGDGRTHKRSIHAVVKALPLNKTDDIIADGLTEAKAMSTFFSYIGLKKRQRGLPRLRALGTDPYVWTAAERDELKRIAEGKA